MEYIKNGVIGGPKFWKYRNKKENLDPKNQELTTNEMRDYFSQLILGLDFSKNFFF